MYERHEGSSNESITSQKLNHLEEGISNLYGGSSVSSTLVVNATEDDTYGYLVLDKTGQEIYDAFYAGSRVIIKYVGEHGYDTHYVFSVYSGDQYHVDIYDSVNYYAESSDEYPHTQGIG